MQTVTFICEPDPENAGWMRWDLNDPTLFNHAVIGPMLARKEAENSCRTRMTVAQHHKNTARTIHGGAILGFIDVSLFAAAHLLRGGDAARAVTLDLATQFVGSGDAGRPLDALVEVLRETRRLIFLRGLVVQDDDLVASFSATIRKSSSRPA